MDLSIEPQDTRLRTTVAAGPAKVRRRFTAAPRFWTFTLGPINGAEKVTLEAWYASTLVQGSLAFDWPDETGTVRSFRFVDALKFRLIAPHHLAAQRLWDLLLVLEQLP